MSDRTIELLEEVLEFLEDQYDVRDGSYGEQTPNKAMSLGMQVERALDELKRPQPKTKKLGFAAAVREFGDNWIHAGFQWNGESYRGLAPATVIALQDSRGPDDEDYYRMKRCFAHGRDYQL